MAGKLATVVACLVFAIPFGGVGVFASWAIGSTLTDAYRAKEWVRVKASVGDATLTSGGDTFRAEGSYRYTFQGNDFTGSRLGISRVGGSDNIDDWHHEVNARLTDARSAGKPITVWVNPDNPSESVFDRSVRWGEILFMTPFALAFGGVGVGALIVAVAVLRGPRGRASASAIVSPDKSGNATPGFLWLFAFFWNALSFPIAILVISDVVANGEWAGLLVLIFPLVGVGLLWAAIATTWNAWRERRRKDDTVRPSPTRSLPGGMAAQAAKAMFNPGSAIARGGFSPGSARGVEIPASLATVEEGGGTLSLHYSPRRWLRSVVILSLVGGILTAIGAVAIARVGLAMAPAVGLLVGIAIDVAVVAMLIGQLEVNVRQGRLEVRKRGILGRREWQLRRDQVSAIRPVLSFRVNDYPYFALHAVTDAGEEVPVGNAIKGPELADTLARRIGRTLGLAPSGIVSTTAIPTTD